MSADPRDRDDEATDPNDEPLVPPVAEELSEIVLPMDTYGIKGTVRIPLGDAQSPPVPPDYPLLSWQEVWWKCQGSLQGCVMNLTQLLAVLPETAVTTIRNLGRIGSALAQFTERIARGRTKVDHREDEKIADVETAPPTLPEPAQARSEEEAVLDRLKSQQAVFRERGLSTTIARNDRNQWVILLVRPEVERYALEQGQKKLLEVAPEWSSDGQALRKPPAIPLTQLGIDGQIVRALESAGITTLDELRERTTDEIRTIKGIGPKRFEVLQPFLRAK
jgi:hypothetical protein